MASFYEFHDTVAQLEGGYQNLSSDPGNYNSRGEQVGTNYGISAPVYEQWIGRVPSVYDMKAITLTIAKNIFESNYWRRLNAHNIVSQKVAETLVDMGVNSGTGRAAKIMQEVLNNFFGKSLNIDGAIGLLSVNAINSVNPVLLFQEYNDARIRYYESLPNKEWLNIWINRVKKISEKFGIPLKKKQ